jgi:hypothetical protein
MMTDLELAEYLGVANDPDRDKFIAGLKPEQRAMFDHMAEIEVDLNLWAQGLGPKPSGVIVCEDQCHAKR